MLSCRFYVSISTACTSIVSISNYSDLELHLHRLKRSRKLFPPQVDDRGYTLWEWIQVDLPYGPSILQVDLDTVYVHVFDLDTQIRAISFHYVHSLSITLSFSLFFRSIFALLFFSLSLLWYTFLLSNPIMKLLTFSGFVILKYQITSYTMHLNKCNFQNKPHKVVNNASEIAFEMLKVIP